MDNGENGNGNGGRFVGATRFLNQWQGVFSVISLVVVVMFSFNKLDKTVAVMETTAQLTTKNLSKEIQGLRRSMNDLAVSVSTLKSEINDIRSNQIVALSNQLAATKAKLESLKEQHEREIDELKGSK